MAPPYRFGLNKRYRSLIIFLVFILISFVGLIIHDEQCSSGTSCSRSRLFEKGLLEAVLGGTRKVYDPFYGHLPTKDEDERIGPSTNGASQTLGPGFCPICGPGDALCVRYGQHNLARSIAYEGGTFALRRKLNDAKQGKPLRVAVLGGSVSHGHGVTKDENWSSLVRDWLQNQYPNSEVTLENGANAATSSDYFSVCFLEHIDANVDIVFIELGINDQRSDFYAESYEYLVRGLLELPTKPAVIHLQVIGLMFDHISTGNDVHIPIAQYYDTPAISLRNVLLPHILALEDPTSALLWWFRQENKETLKPDLRHIGPRGHALAADLIIHFMQRIICSSYSMESTYSANGGKLNDQDLGAHEIQNNLLPNYKNAEGIPRQTMMMKFDHTTKVMPIKSTCMSTTTRHPLVAAENIGWRNWTWEQGWVKKPYVIADEPGSRIAFNLELGGLGRARITYLRSKDFPLGIALCWIERKKDGKKIKGETFALDGHWNLNMNVGQGAILVEGEQPGPIQLICEIAEHTNTGGHEFRLIAVDSS